MEQKNIINGLSLVEDTNELVVFKNEVKTPLEIAKHPYLGGNYEYITVSKGKYDHTITIVKSDGTTFSYEYGRRGHTLVTKNLITLRDKMFEAVMKLGISLEG